MRKPVVYIMKVSKMKQLGGKNKTWELKMRVGRSREPTHGRKEAGVEREAPSLPVSETLGGEPPSPLKIPSWLLLVRLFHSKNRKIFGQNLAIRTTKHRALAQVEGAGSDGCNLSTWKPEAGGSPGV